MNTLQVVYECLSVQHIQTKRSNISGILRKHDSLDTIHNAIAVLQVLSTLIQSAAVTMKACSMAP